MHIHDLASARITVPDADICICAGDVSGHFYVTWHFLLRRVAPVMDVILVLGNHDYYGRTIDFTQELLRLRSRDTNVALLENGAMAPR
ncbi:metallophosphoesterase [Agrobacterium sp.]|uniref:metallophosphoesterase n=1 Tax=Agrobacterium sp. TaxID=361 RepID=UPI0028A71B41